MKVNNEHYVSYELGKHLQELGFAWECRYYYIPGNDKLLEYKDVEKEHILALRNKFKHILIPTLSMAQAWLRDVKKCDITVYHDIKIGGYTVTLYIAGNTFERVYSGEHYNGENDIVFKTYEDAQEAGIAKTIGMLLEIEKMKKNPIDTRKCPQNDFVTFYYPDGSEIVKTNDDVMFNYVRNEIRKKRYSGCYLITQRGLNKIKIDKYGNLESWPEHLFSANLKILEELIGDEQVKKQKQDNFISMIGDKYTPYPTYL